MEKMKRHSGKILPMYRPHHVYEVVHSGTTRLHHEDRPYYRKHYALLHITSSILHAGIIKY